MQFNGQMWYKFNFLPKYLGVEQRSGTSQAGNTHTGGGTSVGGFGIPRALGGIPVFPWCHGQKSCTFFPENKQKKNLKCDFEMPKYPSAKSQRCFVSCICWITFFCCGRGWSEPGRQGMSLCILTTLLDVILQVAIALSNPPHPQSFLGVFVKTFTG